MVFFLSDGEDGVEQEGSAAWVDFFSFILQNFSLHMWPGHHTWNSQKEWGCLCLYPWGLPGAEF